MRNEKSRFYDWKRYKKELERRDCYVYCIKLYGRLGTIETVDKCYTTYAAARDAADRISYIYMGEYMPAERVVDRSVYRVRVLAE